MRQLLHSFTLVGATTATAAAADVAGAVVDAAYADTVGAVATANTAAACVADCARQFGHERR